MHPRIEIVGGGQLKSRRRQHEVGQQQIDRLMVGGQDLQRLRTAFCFKYRKPFGTECLGADQHHGWIVVDDQDRFQLRRTDGRVTIPLRPPGPSDLGCPS